MAPSTKTARLLALPQITLLVVAMASSVCHGARDTSWPIVHSAIFFIRVYV
uniref:Uncharacterized protein n=1 Tax=Setaria viridis TaxID=4556 RepID=A0A4U6VGN8_SETVI|nr:hypothetical protein SEVIR_4G285506v2 [Setaria viridis]